ncbi:MAG: 6-phospho-beta-glucosidase [Chloroflexi bacterium]|nr:MAG: 6-phospho-beta-glucosidase [Chloroflexota bacterium]
MKLVLVGGGGVRSPLFVMSLLNWQKRIGVDELCLMDIDGRKLDLFGAICRQIVKRAGDPFKITTTLDARAAFEGARHVVTTMRAGQDIGRAIDERIALKHGVLGQETTGPGGFAMAMRSIPALLEYARLLQEVSPGAWMYNFTNPAGLVTQALRDSGFTRTVGICDGANGGQGAIAAWAGVDMAQVRAEVFGLNHLSWCRRAFIGEENVMPAALADERFLVDMQHLFEPDLVRQIGMHCNEYLYYYYYAEQALQAILSESKSRGEEIVELNQRLLDQLEEVDIERNPEQALRIFFGYEKRRGATYMHYAYGGASIAEADRQLVFDADIPEQAGEGYAGVALAVIEALEHGGPLHIALNVPNQGAIQGMARDDVVEVSCRVDGDGIHVMDIGQIPPAQLNLMKTIKLYEHLSIEAILTSSRTKAVEALMVHPLVLSYPRARALVDDYLKAHIELVGEWK